MTGELLFNGHRVSSLQDEEFWTSVTEQCECI